MPMITGKAQDDFDNLEFVQSVAEALENGATLASIAADLSISEAAATRRFGIAVNTFLDAMFTRVEPPPEDGALFVCVPGGTDDVIESIRDALEEELPDGAELYMANFDVTATVVGPVAHDQLLVASAEDMDQADTDELRAQLEEAFPGTNMIVANFTIDVETMDPAQVTVLRDKCNAVLAAEEAKAGSAITMTWPCALAPFRELADRYLSAVSVLAGVEKPARPLDVEIRSTENGWHLRFLEVTPNGDNSLHECVGATREDLETYAESSVESVESFAAVGGNLPTA
jgi:hypothetical protein